MAEAVMLSTIESLDCWLLKKGGILEENLEKLYSLIAEMSDLGDEKKEMVHSLMLQLREKYNEDQVEDDEDEDEEDDEDEDEDESEDDEDDDDSEESDEDEEKSIEKKIYNLLDLNKEKMYSLVVGMVDFWEDYKEILYYLLLWAAMADMKGKEKMQSMVVEIVDLWEVDEGELNKEKLHGVLFQMQYMCKQFYGNKLDYLKKKMQRMSDEVARPWKDKQPKLNKEKLYTWLANKKNLFLVLLDTVLLYDSTNFCNRRRNWEKATREGVEGAKRELGEILDLITYKELREENSLRYFISDVVDIAYHAHFLVHLMDSDPYILFFELSILLQGYVNITYRERFGKRFERIVNELQEIKVSMLGFGAERLPNGREMEGGENVVDDDVTSMFFMLQPFHYNTQKITVIVGMAGIGKTTLARQVYNHTNITQQFVRRAWVCLSKVFSRKEMLVSLIRQLADSSELSLLEKIECADYETLKQVLHQLLLGMRYFIVLDDVSYNTTHLKYVKKALLKDKQGSKLLLTTRNAGRYILLCQSHKERVHTMKFMDANRSWKLLLKTLSTEGSVEEFPKHLVTKARQILTKCGGLPLAIKEVGRNWANKRQMGIKWEELIESISLTETIRTLETVYNDWNPQLQSRFLHLAFFKEGTTIRAKRLVHIWIIMGVVSGNKEGYLDNLFELSTESVIYIESDVNNNLKTCCVQTVFHMLSIKLAEDKLKFEILRKDGNNRPSQHRAIYCSREKLMNDSSDRDKHLVSLFFYGGGYFNASPSYWKHFEQLETLDMEDFGLKILPDAIGKLNELRYLGLRNNYIQDLPHSLSHLKKLEVLDIALNFVVEVSDIISEMESLRHLYMSDISCRKPLRIDLLKNLETWTYVSFHNWAYEASRLEMMTSLTKLGIQEVDGNTAKLFASLAELKNLESLILRGFRFKSISSLNEIGVLWNLRELKLDGLITRLPSAINFPQNIKNLSLVNSCLRKDPMPILGKLSSLSFLKLQNAYIGQQMVILRNGFSKLTCLVIEELWHLTNVQFEEGGMSWLRNLEINSCPNLETLQMDNDSSFNWMSFKMITTKKNVTKLRESSFVSTIAKYGEVDIQP